MPAPSNGTCATATVITSTPYSIVVDTTGASTDTEVTPPCGFSGGAKSVWWTYTNNTSRYQLIEVDTGGSNYLHDVTAWTGTTCGSLTNVACRVLTYSGDGIYCSFAAAPLTQYWLFIPDDGTGLGGSLHLSVTAVSVTAGAVIGCFNPGSETKANSLTSYSQAGSLLSLDNSNSTQTLLNLAVRPSGNLLSLAGNKVYEFSPATGLLSTTTVTPPTATTYSQYVLVTAGGQVWFVWYRTPGNTIVYLQRVDATSYAVLETHTVTFDTTVYGTAFFGQLAPNGLSFYFGMSGGSGTDQNKIYQWTLATDAISTFATYGTWSGGINPTGNTFETVCTFDTAGNLYTVEEHQTTGAVDGANVLIYAPNGTLSHTYAITYSAGACVIPRVLLDASQTHLWTCEESGYASAYAVSGGAKGASFLMSTGSTLNDLVLTPASVPVTTTYPIRRMRRFLISYNQNYLQFLRRIEFVLQPGVGLTTGQGSDPILMFRLSRDGGFTWGPERQMSVGQIGDYLKRAYVLALGQGRNLVGEISTSDPCAFYLVQCVADLDQGFS